MQFKKILLTEDIEESLEIRVDEVVKGHKYHIKNRHTDGFEELSFVRFMTYQQMIDEGMPTEMIEAIVPKEERQCESCKYYITMEGVFTQDVIHALIMRMSYQYGWLKNGFYKKGIEALQQAEKQYELFTEIRQKYGFYHIPFTIENFIDKLKLKSEEEVQWDRSLINTFFEIDETVTVWNNKRDLIELIKNR